MIEKPTKFRLLEFFFLNPTTAVHLRELERKTRISLPSVIEGVKYLAKLDLLQVEQTQAITFVRAKRTTSFLRAKRLSNLERLYASGFVDAILTCRPEAIILFGSYSKGEDTEKSDIDIAILNPGKKPDLSGWEKRLHRNISVHLIGAHMNKELHDNLKNGIVLEGAW